MAEVTPFSKVSDVDVAMTVIKPQPLVGLGNLLILTKTPEAIEGEGGTTGGTTGGVPNNATSMTGLLMSKTDTESGAVYKEYANIDAVEKDYADDSKVYKEADSYFAQKNASDHVAILSYPNGKLDVALKNFWYNNWTFAVFSDKPVTDDIMDASNIFEANKDHFLIYQSNDIKDFKELGGQDYTIGLKHDPTEPMDAALVGSTGSLPVGSVVWKFRELTGITPESLTTTEYADINETHAIAYVEVNGVGETTEGWSLSGEYIDNLHGDIWIKNNMQSKLESLLQDSGKIPYDQKGINLVRSVVTEVLSKAWERGIIMTDEASGKGAYKVDAASRASQSAQDISARKYNGISFSYHRAGAIHSIKINGTIQSDTIFNG